MTKATPHPHAIVLGCSCYYCEAQRKKTALEKEIPIWGPSVVSLEATERLADLIAYFARYRQDQISAHNVIKALGVGLVAMNQIAAVIATEEGIPLVEVLQRASAYQAATDGARARLINSTEPPA